MPSSTKTTPPSLGQTWTQVGIQYIRQWLDAIELRPDLLKSTRVQRYISQIATDVLPQILSAHDLEAQIEQSPSLGRSSLTSEPMVVGMWQQMDTFTGEWVIQDVFSDIDVAREFLRGIQGVDQKGDYCFLALSAWERIRDRRDQEPDSLDREQAVAEESPEGSTSPSLTERLAHTYQSSPEAPASPVPLIENPPSYREEPDTLRWATGPGGVVETAE